VSATTRAVALLAALCPAAGCQCGEPVPPRTDIPVYEAERTNAPPALDGRLDDAAWRDAPETAPFVRTMDGAAGEPATTARFAWDDEHLYIAFDIADELLKCTFEGHDANLWEQDVAEVMIDPDSDGRNYVELQVSPTNLVFDTRFDLRRSPPPAGERRWSSHLRAGVEVRGAPNDDDDDDGYTVEMAVPFRSLVDARATTAPPAAGDEWRVALYVLDARAEGQLGVGWSAPLVGDFHVPDRFGRVRFR
jgi:hypothetical protein